jgi:hypothetical protein
MSDDRLSLVQRYMIDAEEAEARARAATEKSEPYARRAAAEQTPRLVEQAGREAEEGPRQMEAPPAAAATREAEQAECAAQGAMHLTKTKQDGQTRTALERAEQRAVKEAARLAAALEKREARERKALAKAAAKRRVANEKR